MVKITFSLVFYYILYHCKLYFRWAYLNLKTSTNYDDETQAFAAGMAEASHSADLIHDQWMNTIDGYCSKPYSTYCTKLQKFLQANLDWMNQQIKTNTSSYWRMVIKCLLWFDQISVSVVVYSQPNSEQLIYMM